MLSLEIINDTVVISGDINSLPKTINLDIINTNSNQIVIFDPVPHRGRQIANAIIHNERNKNG